MGFNSGFKGLRDNIFLSNRGYYHFESINMMALPVELAYVIYTERKV